MSGEYKKTLEQLGSLRVELASRFNLIDQEKICPLWVTDFPLFEWDEEEKRFFSMHHPFTSPKPEFLEILDKEPEKVIANARGFTQGPITQTMLCRTTFDPINKAVSDTLQITWSVQLTDNSVS